jgi:hypothetical protein
MAWPLRLCLKASSRWQVMRHKTPTHGRYVRTALTLLRAAKSRDQYKYSPGGREKRRTRPTPSLPRLSILDNASLPSEGPALSRLQHRD